MTSDMPARLPLTSHKGLFVTGTDTGVGKTLVSCALLHAYTSAGLRTVGMKPVAAGCELGAAGLVCEDVEALWQASSERAPLDLVNPYAFTPPIAPHIAAVEAGVAIDLEHIRRAYIALAELADKVVVEGVGGFRVPLDARFDTADLARLLGLPVVLVVGMRLGCLSHTLLTVESIAARGLRLAGWVANRVDPEMARFEANVETLKQRIDAPLLGCVPHMPQPDCAEAARALLSTLP